MIEDEYRAERGGCWNNQRKKWYQAWKFGYTRTETHGIILHKSGKFSTSCTNIGTAAIIASYFAPPPYNIALAISGTIMIYIGSAASSFGW